ncbi:MAG: hypothetical protein R3C10_14565 [Pirellulales bacterium]
MRRHPRTRSGAIDRRALIRYAGCVAVMTAFLHVAGCGSEHPGMVEVTGVLTVDGGPPPTSGEIYFNGTESYGGFPLRPGTGFYDETGQYTIKTHTLGDGLYPGKYVVSVHCYKQPPNMEGKPVESYIAAKWNSGVASGLTLEVPVGSDPLNFPIDVTTAE